MTNIRRYHTPNARVFMTVVCRNRAGHLATTGAKELLLSVMREVKRKLPFSMLGYVILDDHFHWLIRMIEELPRGVSESAAHTLTYNGGYAGATGHAGGAGPEGKGLVEGVGQVATAASYLTNRDESMPDGDVPAKPAISALMQAVKLRFTHRYKKDAGISTHLSVWQRRFWDHIIRDQEDFNRHLDYIHYNPVKHGYVSDPLEFEWSSFRTYLERGKYRTGWGCGGEPDVLSGIAWE